MLLLAALDQRRRRARRGHRRQAAAVQTVLIAVAVRVRICVCVRVRVDEHGRPHDRCAVGPGFSYHQARRRGGQQGGRDEQRARRAPLHSH